MSVFDQTDFYTANPECSSILKIIIPVSGKISKA